MLDQAPPSRPPTIIGKTLRKAPRGTTGHGRHRAARRQGAPGQHAPARAHHGTARPLAATRCFRIFRGKTQRRARWRPASRKVFKNVRERPGCVRAKPETSKEILHGTWLREKAAQRCEERFHLVRHRYPHPWRPGPHGEARPSQRPLRRGRAQAPPQAQGPRGSADRIRLPVRRHRRGRCGHAGAYEQAPAWPQRRS